MPSLTAKKIHGRTYWYLRESAWVDGKSKIVSTRYLGTAEEVAAKLGEGSSGLNVVPGTPVFDFGAVAALFSLAERLHIVELIDRHVPKRTGTAPSVGTYLLLDWPPRPTTLAPIHDQIPATAAYCHHGPDCCGAGPWSVALPVAHRLLGRTIDPGRR